MVGGALSVDIGALHLTRPQWLIGLLPMALTLWLLSRHWHGGGNWHRVMDPELMAPLMERGARSHWLLATTVLALCWSLAFLALAGPAWERAPQSLRQSREALLILLDTSRSMHATDLAPSRMKRARDKVMDILELRRDGIYGLIAYAGDAYVITPMTDDGETVRNLARALSPDIMPTRGSNPVAAMKQGLELLRGSQLRSGRVLLITDGIDNANVMPMAHLVNDSGLELGILGVGTLSGAPIVLPKGGQLRDASGRVVQARLGRRALQRLGRATDGVYREITLDDSDIEDLLAHSRPVAPTTQDTERQVEHWREISAALVLAMLPLALAAFRRGWMAVLALTLALLGVPPPASALEAADWWRSPDQRGKHLLDQGQHEEAVAQFRDPAWRATTLYRAGRHREATELWGESDDPHAHYNRGNALARQGQIKEAIDAYRAALEQAPAMDDAYANLNLLRSLSTQERQEVARQADERQDEQSEEDNTAADQSTQGGQGGQSEEGDTAADQNAQGGQGGQRGEDDTAAGQNSQGGQEQQGQSEQSEGNGGQQQADRDTADEAREDDIAGESNEPGTASEGEERTAAQESADGAATADNDDGGAEGRLAALQRQHEAERAREAELWLRQVPEGNPNQLLRNKLRLQHERRQRQGQTDTANREPW